ncbi:MAG: tellurite resistance/C4-dicarboxylate transporter family protein [Candidatus Dormibacterales bacterium]
MAALSVGGAGRRLDGALRELPPGSFSLVMATGIVALALRQAGAYALSTALVAVGTASYAALAAMFVARAARHSGQMAADARSSHRAFGFFTFVAASNVLAEGYLLSGARDVGIALSVLGFAGYALLTYAVPAWGMLQPSKRTFGEAVDGSWLLWVVATQSVSTSAATLASSGLLPGGLGTVAVLFWALGVVLYLILIVIVMMRLLLIDLAAEQLSPPYWICMGATAITVLAGSHLLRLPASLPIEQTSRATVRGLSLLLWAFGTWWIPMLVLFGIHRHVWHRRPLRYEHLLWSMVFPLGMYAASSREFGDVEGLDFMVRIAQVGVWVALAAWLAVAAAMVWAFVGARTEPPGAPVVP